MRSSRSSAPASARLVGGVADGLDGSLTAPLAAALGVAVGAALTGALHLDALADTADALGARTRERALEIMRDHAIGAYGAVALVLALLGEGGGARRARSRRARAALRRLRGGRRPGRAGRALRGAAVRARGRGASGRVLGGGSWLRVVVAAAIAAGFCVWLDALPLLAAAAGVALVVGVAARRWLGGVTGDVLGASAELAELAALVVAVAVA